MATYVPAPLFKYGLNMAEGDLLYTYQANSSTPLAVHTDSTGASATNPVEADTRGEADVWLQAGVAYKFIHKTSAGVTISTVDQVIALNGYAVNTTSTPAALAQGAYNFPQWCSFAVTDQTNAVTSGAAKFTKTIHRACTIQAVGASLKTASSSGPVTVDINDDGVSIFSTVITIDANETDTSTAATPPVIANASVGAGSVMTIDIDTAGTNAVGLIVDFLVNWTS